MRRAMFFPPLEREVVPGARGVAVVGHGEKDLAVFPPLLPLQPLQHPLVAQGLHVVAHPVEGVPQEGVAPVEGPEKGPAEALEGVEVVQVEQLVEENFIVHRFPVRDRQHRAHHAAHKGGGQAPDPHRPTGFQTVPIPHPGQLFLQFRSGGSAPGQQQPQTEVGEQVPSQGQDHPGGVENQQPVGEAGGPPGQDGEHMVQMAGLVDGGVGRI